MKSTRFIYNKSTNEGFYVKVLPVETMNKVLAKRRMELIETNEEGYRIFVEHETQYMLACR